VGLSLPLELLNEDWCLSWGEGADEITACVTNPLGVSWAPGSDIVLVGVLIAVLAAAVSSVVRFRRSRGLERRQMKVFAFGVALIFVSLIGPELTSIITESPQPALEHLWNLILWSALPVCTAVAILRHGLYEIDRIISRSVAYVLVVILLGAAFAGIVVGLSTVLSFDSNVAIAGATLVVFFAFRPLATRLQRQVDRIFNRQPYDAESLLDDFHEKIRDEVDSERLAFLWADAVGATLEPSAAGVWLREE
jgi:hypothetical protein